MKGSRINESERSGTRIEMVRECVQDLRQQHVRTREGVWYVHEGKREHVTVREDVYID